MARTKAPINGNGNTQEKKKPGPKPRIPTKEECELALKFALLGATYEKIAALLEITEGMLETWINGNEEFKAAIREGQDIALATVGKAVYDRARGYDVIEKTFERRVVRDTEGNPVMENGVQKTEMVCTRELHKHILPDIAAAKFYMWNRTKTLPKDQRWHDNQQLDLTSSDGSMTPKEAVIKAGMDPKEAVAAYKQMIQDTKK